MPFHSLLYYLGYCIALYLYKDMGRIFFVPMLLNLWFNLLILFQVYRHVDFRWLVALHGMLWLIWILVLASENRKKLDITLAILLLVGSFVIGTLPQLRQKADAFKAMIELCNNIWTVWFFSAFIVVFVVIVRSTIVARMKHEFIDILTNPRKRFLLPLGIQSALVGIAPLFEGALSPDIIRERFNIGSHIMVWGWVVLELPFYIMYERMKRQEE